MIFNFRNNLLLIVSTIRKGFDHLFSFILKIVKSEKLNSFFKVVFPFGFAVYYFYNFFTYIDSLNQFMFHFGLDLRTRNIIKVGISTYTNYYLNQSLNLIYLTFFAIVYILYLKKPEFTREILFKFIVYIKTKLLIFWNFARYKTSAWLVEFRASSIKHKLKMLRYPIFIYIFVFAFVQIKPYLVFPAFFASFPDNNATEVPLDSSVEIIFNTYMNRKSVENAFRIEPNVEGSFDWESDQKFIFTPKSKYERDKQYRVHFNGVLLSKSGLPMFKKIEVKFTALGNPKVIVATPATEVLSDDTAITLVFDRAMIPLTTVDEKEKFLSPITIEPNIKGTGRWLGTSAYQFTPAEPFKKGTMYQVTVAGGLKSQDGGEMKDSYVWQFSGLIPRIETYSPENNYLYANPYGSLTVGFNQQIDLDSFEKNIKLKNSSTGEIIEGVASYDYRNKQIVIYKPIHALERSRTYSVEITSRQNFDGIRGIEGPLEMEGKTSWYFTTTPLPKIIGTTPTNGSLDVGEMYDIHISFVSPMDSTSLRNNIVISPKGEAKAGGYTSYNSYVMTTYLQRSSKYKVTVLAGAKDIYGTPLGSDYSFEFTTAPFNPAINIEPANTYYSTFNQYIEPRIVSKVVNADYLEYSLYKLGQDDFMHLYRLRSDYYYQQEKCGKGNDRYPDPQCVNWQTYVPPQNSFEKYWKQDTGGLLNVPISMVSMITNKNNEKLSPGVYYLDIKIPNGTHDNTVLIVSKTVLTIKQSLNQILVWATDQYSGEPVADMNLDLIDNTGKYKIASGRTNKDGVWVSPANVSSASNQGAGYFVVGTKGDDYVVASTTWNSGITPSDFGIPQSWDAYQKNINAYKLFVTLDNPLYRPGETLKFKGLIKKDNDGAFSSLRVGEKVKVTITSTNDVVSAPVFEQNFPINSYGSFWGDFKLANEIAVGDYWLNVSYNESSFTQQFQVEEYRKPDFALSINPSKNSFVNGDNATAIINASYYFGAPLADKKVTWSVKTNDYDFHWSKNYTYEFGDRDFNLGYWWNMRSANSGKLLTQGENNTDSQGDLVVKVPSDISSYDNSQDIVVDASIIDQNNQGIASSKSFTIHKGNYYVGIKAESYVNKPNQKAKVNLVTVDTNGKEVGDKEIKVRFYKRTWNTIRKENPDDGIYYYENVANDELVAESETSTDDFGYGTTDFEPESGGTYRIVARSTDEDGNTVKSATYLWVYGDGFYGQRENNDRIPLISDKKSYFVGETASFVAGTPYKNRTKSLFTVERSNVLDYFIADAGADSESFKLKIKDTYSPNVYISVLSPKGGTDVKAPAEFKMGYTPITVTNKKNNLNIDLTVDKTSYHPQDKMKVNINVKDLNGTGRKSELVLGVVDKAVWDQSTVTFEEIYNHFYKPKNISVTTSNTLTISMDRINANTDLGSKGGSGGGGGSGFFETSRTEFLSTAYWVPNLETDSNGNAQVIVDLPDNLTTWKIIAIAATEDAGFGSNTISTITSKDMIIRPFLPRFLSTGDKAQLGALVLNRTQNSQRVTVELKTEGIVLSESPVKSIKIDSGDQVKLTWNTTTISKDKVKLGIAVKNSDGVILDAVETEIPAYVYYVPEAVATSGEVQGIKEETVAIPSNIVKEIGDLSVLISPNVAMGGLVSIDYMLNYPYDCNEQASSKLLSAVLVNKILQKTGINNFGSADQSNLNNIINEKINLLIVNQRMDGAWGWWQNDYHNPPDAYLTAYAYHALDLASKNGANVSPIVFANAERVMKVFLNDINLSLDTKAYIVSVLSDKSWVAPYASNLYTNRFSMSIEARAHLADAMLKLSGMNSRAKIIEKELTGLLKKQSTTTYWSEKTSGYYYGYSFGNDVTTTSAVIKLLTDSNHNNVLIPEALKYLNITQKDKFWISTNTTAQVIESLVNYLDKKKAYNLDEVYKLEINNQKIFEGNWKKQDFFTQLNKYMSVSDLNTGDNKVTFNKSGQGNMFYNMTLKYYLPFDKVKPQDQGFTVIREFYDDFGNVKNLSKITEGDMYWVKLTVITPQNRNYVIIEDMLPAGLESVNESLKDASVFTQNPPAMGEKVTTNENEFDMQKYYLDYYFQRKEFRDNRTVFFSQKLPTGVYQLTYRVRATTPGKYHHAPAHAYEMYTPDVFGHSDGDWMEVLAK